jgi:hypothetical protein
MSTSGRDNHDDLEDRLRAALRHRAGDFTASPDAWQRTLARRGDPTTRLRTARAGHRRWSGWIAPLAAAAAVVAIAAGLLIARGPAAPRPAPGVSATPAPRGLSPTHNPTPKGLRIPATCAGSTPPPPAYSVTEVPTASTPAPVRAALRKTPPITSVVRVDMSYRGDRSVLFFWMTHHSGYPVILEDRIALLLPPGANLDTVKWGGDVGYQTSLPAGQPGQLVRAEGDRLVTYAIGLAASQVASVTVAPGENSPTPVTGLDGPSTPVPGVVFTAPGFPARLWVAAFPATPLYGGATLRDAAGATVGHVSVNPFPVGQMCMPLAELNTYEPPDANYAYAGGVSLPQVATVTAVLPDGSQVRGGFIGTLGPEPPVWEWEVRFPVKDANLTVTLVFRDAAGRVLGHFTTIPGKDPFSNPR